MRAERNIHQHHLIGATYLCYADGCMLPEDELLSPAQAAERIGLPAHTFRRRAAQAVAKGDKRIRKTRHGYLATEAVWREYSWPVKVGRPTKQPPAVRPGTSSPRPPESPKSPATH
jgi:hypothetical protein